jgi:hypothetical protein
MTLPLLLVLDHGTALMGLWGLAGEGCAFGVGGGARAPRDIGESGLPHAVLSGLAGLTGLVGTPGVSGEKYDVGWCACRGLGPGPGPSLDVVMAPEDGIVSPVEEKERKESSART